MVNNRRQEHLFFHEFNRLFSVSMRLWSRPSPSFWRDCLHLMRTTSPSFMWMPIIGHRWKGLPYTCLRKTFPRNKVFFWTSFKCQMFMFGSVIVTEKTNILLRYLHHHWEKKVCICKLERGVEPGRLNLHLIKSPDWKMGF